MINNIRNFLNENQDPKAIEKIADKLNGILMSGEDVIYIAVQKKPAVNISPDCVALTNKRIIFCRPKNLGFSMEFQDYLWKDVADCHLKEEIFGALFTVKALHGETNSIDYLPKAQARKLYAVSQEQEEIQTEYRRQRQMEEKRAGAGSVVVNPHPTQSIVPEQVFTPAPASFSPPAPIPAPAPPVKPEDPFATLQKLKALYDNGLITQSEFEAKKAEVLQRM